MIRNYIFPPVPPTSPTSTYLTKSDLNNIHNTTKACNDKHHSEMRSMNKHIAAMLATLNDTSAKKKSKKKNSQIFHPKSQLMKTT